MPPSEQSSLHEFTLLTSETLYGSISYFSFDGPIGDSLGFYGEWAAAEIDFLSQFIEQGSTVVDAGANIGVHTLAMSRFCGSAGRVVAIEASPQIYSVLMHNKSQNELDNIQCINAALGGDTEPRYIPALQKDGRQNAGILQVSSTPNDSLGFTVPSTTLDLIEAERISFVKLDIEGSELAALQSAPQVLTRHRPVIFTEYLPEADSTDLIKLMISANYRILYCEFPIYNKSNFCNNAVNIFDSAIERALLFVPIQYQKLVIRKQARVVEVADLNHWVFLTKAFARSAPQPENETAPQEIDQSVDKNNISPLKSADPESDQIDRVTTIEQQLQESISTIKYEMAALKQILLDRSEDRSALILSIDDIRQEMLDSKGQIAELDSRLNLEQEMLDLKSQIAELDSRLNLKSLLMHSVRRR